MFRKTLLASAIISSALVVACGDSNSPDTPAAEATPNAIQMNYLGRYETGQFGVSAAEIPAYDAASKRAFVVNSQEGALDVLDMADPANPVLIETLRVDSIDGLPSNLVVNSVAVQNGLVAVAIESTPKTNTGYMAIYKASDLAFQDVIEVGSQPDMLVFTPDNKFVLVANEGEPSDDYQVDPEGSVSIIDVTNPKSLKGRTAGFRAFNAQVDELKAKGLRVFGPNATLAQDLEPEYIAISPDSKTAYVALQENNALAVVDIATARVMRIMPLGFKDHGVEGNGFDASDRDDTVNIRTWPGVLGMYQPDAIAVHRFNGIDYVLTANEGDARAWGETNPAYWGAAGAGCQGDSSQGFVEEFTVNHLTDVRGFARRCGDDLPPQLRQLAAGALLNPATFAYCGAALGNVATNTPATAGDCRLDGMLGRLKITWTEGYQRNDDGTPKLYDRFGQPATAETPAADTRLMYDNLYSYGGRSMAVFNGSNGELVWDSKDFIEQHLAGDNCFAGVDRDRECKLNFNSNHATTTLDTRSRNKGPEPEGVVLGAIGNKTFAFLGLERVGGVMAFDITDPRSPVFQDYLNSRDFAKPSLEQGDLGAEGLAFVPASVSPTGKPLLITGHEVSGTTSVYEVVEKPVAP